MIIGKIRLDPLYFKPAQTTALQWSRCSLYTHNTCNYCGVSNYSKKKTPTVNANTVYDCDNPRGGGDI